jgi:hypothetical protein
MHSIAAGVGRVFRPSLHPAGGHVMPPAMRDSSLFKSVSLI